MQRPTSRPIDLPNTMLNRRQLLQASAGSVGLFGLLGLTVGCQTAAPAGAPAAGGDAAADGPSKLTIAYDSDILKLDPGIQQSGVDWPPAALVYNRLVEYDNTMMAPSPA